MLELVGELFAGAIQTRRYRALRTIHALTDFVIVQAFQIFQYDDHSHLWDIKENTETSEDSNAARLMLAEIISEYVDKTIVEEDSSEEDDGPEETVMRPLEEILWTMPYSPVSAESVVRGLLEDAEQSDNIIIEEDQNEITEQCMPVSPDNVPPEFAENESSTNSIIDENPNEAWGSWPHGGEITLMEDTAAGG